MGLILTHMNDLAAKALKTGCAASKFITPAEAEGIKIRFAKRNDVSIVFDGGYPNAERVRAIFLEPSWGGYNRGELISAIKIEFRQQDILAHRDILGAIMALGIERDTVGDIQAETSPITLVSLPEMTNYILLNLSKAGRVGLTASQISLDELPKKVDNIALKKATVSSLRLDAVMCAAYNLSRSKASDYITAGHVYVNHSLCEQPSKEVEQGALFSVRGLGRAKLIEVGGTSRKGRLFLTIRVYQ